jgi:hypothetical protein
MADELRVHAALADAPRDQLGVLPTEVENENRPIRVAGKRKNLRFVSADSSAPPS